MSADNRFNNEYMWYDRLCSLERENKALREQVKNLKGKLGEPAEEPAEEPVKDVFRLPVENLYENMGMMKGRIAELWKLAKKI